LIARFGVADRISHRLRTRKIPIMRRTTLGPSGLLVAFAVQFGSDASLRADPIRADYTTTGAIVPYGIVGTPFVTFQGVTSGSMTPGQPFSLGEFIVSPQSGATATYNTGFEVTLSVTGSAGDPGLAAAGPVTLFGALNTEAVGGHSVVQVQWDFAQAIVGASPTDDLTYYLTKGGTPVGGVFPLSDPISFDPASGGVFNLEAELDAFTSAPEPTPLALFLAAGTLLLIRRRIRAAKR
jgi:hypothetical protein